MNAPIKLLTILALLFLSISSYAASTEDKVIYDSMNVKAVNAIENMVGSITFEKSVGGLSCWASSTVVLNPKTEYSCAIDEKKYHAEKIYKSLKVTEKNITQKHLAGSVIFAKYVGGLACKKSGAVAAKPVYEYTCTLK